MPNKLRFKVSSSRIRLGVSGARKEEEKEDSSEERPKSKKTKMEKRRLRKKLDLKKMDHSDDRVKK